MATNRPILAASRKCSHVSPIPAANHRLAILARQSFHIRPQPIRLRLFQQRHAIFMGFGLHRRIRRTLHVARAIFRTNRRSVCLPTIRRLHPARKRHSQSLLAAERHRQSIRHTRKRVLSFFRPRVNNVVRLLLQQEFLFFKCSSALRREQQLWRIFYLFRRKIWNRPRRRTRLRPVSAPMAHRSDRHAAYPNHRRFYARLACRMAHRRTVGKDNFRRSPCESDNCAAHSAYAARAIKKRCRLPKETNDIFFPKTHSIIQNRPHTISSTSDNCERFFDSFLSPAPDPPFF